MLPSNGPRKSNQRLDTELLLKATSEFLGPVIRETNGPFSLKLIRIFFPSFATASTLIQ